MIPLDPVNITYTMLFGSLGIASKRVIPDSRNTVGLPRLLNGFCHSLGQYWGLYWGYIGIIEKKMETTKGYIRIIGFILGLYWNN